MKTNINTILYIGVLTFILLVIILKSISITKNIEESFDGHEDPSSVLDAAESALQTEEVEKASEEVQEMTEEDKQELRMKCMALDNNTYGSVISKYTGKTINVDKVEERKDASGKVENLYLIKWQPLGGKPGGCITLEANGTYSTPICNPNISKQLWMIKKISNQEELEKILPEKRRNMGRPLEETSFPFHLILSSQDNNYALNYEGGGLSTRLTANYDGQKWDVSTKKIPQDPLPTQNNNKFTSLNPEHSMSKSDASLGSYANGGNGNGNGGNGNGNGGNGNGNGNGNGKGAVNLNVNLDPELLSRLGLTLGENGELQNLNESLNGKKIESDFLIPDEPNKTGGRGDVSELIKGGGNPNCQDCDKIPERYIKKDLVKSMCIGCDNIDNVLT